MKIELQRFIDHRLGSMLCRLISAWDVLTRRRRPKPKIRRLLVILLSEMGSLVLAQPMLDRLRQQYPHAEVYALIFKKNIDVLEVTGAVRADCILTIDDRRWARFVADAANAVVRMRKLKIDVVIDCELFARISSLLSYLSGAPVRVGFHPHTQEGLYRGSFINRPVLYNPYIHISRQFLTLAAAIESDTRPLAKCSHESQPFDLPRIDFPQEEISDTASRFLHDYPAVTGKLLILVYPSGGILPIRAWPMDYYCKLCRQLTDRGYAVGIIGVASDKPLAGQIRNACASDTCIDLTGYTRSIRELMLLFHHAALLITNDGGPVHFASLTAISTIAFFGPETPLLYGSLKPGTVHLYAGLSCSPCLTAYNHRNSPCDGDNRCLKRITVEAVLKQALDRLARPEKQGVAAIVST